MTTAKQQSHYRGYIQLTKTIYKEEGVKNFFKGGSLVFIQSLGLAVLLYYYDMISKDIQNFYNS